MGSHSSSQPPHPSPPPAAPCLQTGSARRRRGSAGAAPPPGAARDGRSRPVHGGRAVLVLGRARSGVGAGCEGRELEQRPGQAPPRSGAEACGGRRHPQAHGSTAAHTPAHLTPAHLLAVILGRVPEPGHRLHKPLHESGRRRRLPRRRLGVQQRQHQRPQTIVACGSMVWRGPAVGGGRKPAASKLACLASDAQGSRPAESNRSSEQARTRRLQRLARLVESVLEGGGEGAQGALPREHHARQARHRLVDCACAEKRGRAAAAGVSGARGSSNDQTVGWASQPRAATAAGGSRAHRRRRRGSN